MSLRERIPHLQLRVEDGLVTAKRSEDGSGVPTKSSPDALGRVLNAPLSEGIHGMMHKALSPVLTVLSYSGRFGP